VSQWAIAAVRVRCSDLTVLGGNEAPPSPDKPWYPPQLHEYEGKGWRIEKLAKDPPAHRLRLTPKRSNDLPELIDIAERTNPETRSRGNAHVRRPPLSGLSQSAYFPYLVASAGAAYETRLRPFPTLKQGPGPSDVSVTGGSTLATYCRWANAPLWCKVVAIRLRRSAKAGPRCEGRADGGKCGSTPVHQQIVFNRHAGFLRTEHSAAKKWQSLKSPWRAADTVAQSGTARLDNGLATKPDVLKRNTSLRRRIRTEAARGALSDAQVAFVESLESCPPPNSKSQTFRENHFRKIADHWMTC